MAPARRCFTQESAIRNALDHYRLKDARFLAERYQAFSSCEASLFLLATSLYRNNEVHRCLHLIRRHPKLSSARVRLLQARCCLDLEEFKALPFCFFTPPPSGSMTLPSMTAIDSQFGDLACEVLSLLGHAYRRLGDLEVASKYFLACIERNPLIWAAYEEFCYCAKKLVDIKKIFSVERLPPYLVSATALTAATEPNTLEVNTATLSVTSFGARSSDVILQTTAATPEMFTPEVASTPGQCGDLFRPLPTSSAMAAHRPLIAKRQLRHGAQGQDMTPIGQGYPVLAGVSTVGASTSSPSSSTEMSHNVAGLSLDVKESRGTSTVTPTDPPTMALTDAALSTAMKAKYTAEKTHDWTKRRAHFNAGPGRKLFAESASNSAATTPAHPGPERVTRSMAKRMQTSPPPAKIFAPEVDPLDSAAELRTEDQCVGSIETSVWQPSLPAPDHAACSESSCSLMTDLQDLALAVGELAKYNVNRALELFSKLAPHYRRTAHVLCTIAKACFETQRYSLALKEYRQLVSQDPFCLDGMAIYSSCLWHVSDVTALSCLADKLRSFAPDHAESWCAAGNSANLMKDPDAAVDCFNQAVKHDQHFAYAHFLLGSEYMGLGKTDESRRCFEDAIRVCPRNYSAWFGLGLIAYHEENYHKACTLFMKAREINVASSVVATHCGLAYNALGRKQEALGHLVKAHKLNRTDPTPIFHLATFCAHAGRYEEAKKLLQEMKRAAPEEALIDYLQAKISFKQGKTCEGKTALAWASSIDPKSMSAMVRTSLGDLIAIDQAPHSGDDDLGSATPAGILEDEEDSDIYDSSAVSIGEDADAPLVQDESPAEAYDDMDLSQ